MKDTVAHSAHAAANAFIGIAQEDEGKKLTNMQLQKLVFIAHGYCLALLNNEPLFYHNTHAWQWGPVIPKLYKSLQKYGNDLVDNPVEAADSLNEEDIKYAIVKAVYENYGHYSGAELSALTHQENTPWSITWERDKFGIIPNDIISEHYKKLTDTS
ncbi:MAG: DUF4065 domain-containing protein [Candidatus Brocadiaceae bacterium]|nr:DUF4065 domain-containing protein [Candidatus Brocadiaceae bacterium]